MLREPGMENPEAREKLQAAKGGRVGSRKEPLDPQGQTHGRDNNVGANEKE